MQKFKGNCFNMKVLLSSLCVPHERIRAAALDTVFFAFYGNISIWKYKRFRRTYLLKYTKAEANFNSCYYHYSTYFLYTLLVAAISSISFKFKSIIGKLKLFAFAISLRT